MQLLKRMSFATYKNYILLLKFVIATNGKVYTMEQIFMLEIVYVGKLLH